MRRPALPYLCTLTTLYLHYYRLVSTPLPVGKRGISSGYLFRLRLRSGLFCANSCQFRHFLPKRFVLFRGLSSIVSPLKPTIMAIQCGKIHLSKTLGNITFYQMNGKWYARRKSSLTGKRVKKDPRFHKTRVQAGFFARGSKIAASVYRDLQEGQRELSHYRALVAAATKLLRAGRTDAEVISLIGPALRKTAAY